MTGLADVRLPGVDILLRPGTTVVVTLEWQEGALDGRSFSATLDGQDLDVTVEGDSLVVEADPEVTGVLAPGVPASWLLLEDLGGPEPEPILQGVWTPSDDPRAGDSSTVQVTQGSATVNVTVTSGQAAIAGLLGRVQAVEGQVSDLSGDVGELSVDVADLEGDVGDLEGTVTGLSNTVGGMVETVGGLSGAVDSLVEDVGTLEGSVSGLAGDLGDLEGDVQGLSNTVGGLVDDVGGLQNDVGILQGSVSDLTGDLSDLSGDVAGLDGRIEVLEKARHRSHQWYTAGDWDAFIEVPVSNPDNTVSLTASDGVGTATAVAGGGSNQDRRLYILDGLDDVADAEVYVDLTLGQQAGIALRYAQPGAAVIVWSNIIFSANGQVLQGVWEFDGTTLLDTNKGDTDLWGFPSPVLSAEGDGEVVTVKTVRPHQIQAGELIHFDETVGSFGQVFVEDVLDATTFTFSDSTVGTWTGGRWRWVIRTGRRHLAARLVGNRVTWKQWLPGEPEPSWADPDRAVSVLLPDTLIARGGPPPEAGGVGLVVAHLNTSGFVGFNDFSVKVLD